MDWTWEQEPLELWKFTTWSLDFSVFDICFDVSVDVDLDDFSLNPENIVKHCCIVALTLSSVRLNTTSFFKRYQMISTSAPSRSPFTMQIILWLIKNSSSL